MTETLIKLCYATAGVVAVVGTLHVHIAMNNDEEYTRRLIIAVVLTCVGLIAAAQFLGEYF